MDVTPPPAGLLPAETTPPLPEVVTKIVANGVSKDDGAFAALIGGVVSAVLLLLICVMAVLLWCLSRHKGSYVTNEIDYDDDDIDDHDDHDDHDHDDESVGSGTALQIREPLSIKEEK